MLSGARLLRNFSRRRRLVPDDGKTLASFFGDKGLPLGDDDGVDTVPYVEVDGQGRRVLIETYGCQMNVADTDAVASILHGSGYEAAETEAEADVILINTCAIRENAESKVWNRLRHLRAVKDGPSSAAKRKKGGAPARPELVVGVLGCMAERLKERLMEEEQIVDLVVGPDQYRTLPRLLGLGMAGRRSVNVVLSADETYSDITPVRRVDQVQAFVSITRGCSHACTYCIVPHTRGIRERSRPRDSIVSAVDELVDQGVREVMLLGQNVNNYADVSTPSDRPAMADGFSSFAKPAGHGVSFTELLDVLSARHPGTRFRFTSPHPKNFPTVLIDLIAERDNICKSIHVPVQSGSTSMLERMGRGYSRDAFLRLIDEIRSRCGPSVALSTDVIAGFCGETEEEHRETVSLMDQVAFDQAFMFAYSMREKTKAHRRLVDDVPEAVKNARLQEIIDTYRAGLARRNMLLDGTKQLVLVEGPAKRNPETDMQGRSDGNRKVIFTVPDGTSVNVGDFVVATVQNDPTRAVSALRGSLVGSSSIADFFAK